MCGSGVKALAGIAEIRAWHLVDHFLPTRGMPFDDLNRSMTYWLEWNSMFDADATFRLEDLKPADLVQALGLSQGLDLDALPPTLPVDPEHFSANRSSLARSFLTPDISWQDLLQVDATVTRRIFALAKSMGYERNVTSLEELLLKV
jgi:hypothetical protein